MDHQYRTTTVPRGGGGSMGLSPHIGWWVQVGGGSLGFRIAYSVPHLGYCWGSSLSSLSSESLIRCRILGYCWGSFATLVLQYCSGSGKRGGKNKYLPSGSGKHGGKSKYLPRKVDHSLCFWYQVFDMSLQEWFRARSWFRIKEILDISKYWHLLSKGWVSAWYGQEWGRVWKLICFDVNMCTSIVDMWSHLPIRIADSVPHFGVQLRMHQFFTQKWSRRIIVWH